MGRFGWEIYCLGLETIIVYLSFKIRFKVKSNYSLLSLRMAKLKRRKAAKSNCLFCNSALTEAAVFLPAMERIEIFSLALRGILIQCTFSGPHYVKTAEQSSGEG